MRSSVAILFLVASLAWAVAPPVPKPLNERVKMASHIFIGTAEDLWIIDRSGHKVEPQPKSTDFGQAIEMSVRVDEALCPRGWHTNTNVRVLYGGGFFGTSDTHQRFVGKKLIYLTVQGNAWNRDFTASYGWDLAEPLDKKAETEAAIPRTPDEKSK